jgi:hypothetical protein
MERGMEGVETKYHNYDITFNRYESACPNSFGEFVNALKQAGGFREFLCCLTFRIPKGSQWISICVTYHHDLIRIGVDGLDDDTVVAAHNFIRTEWGLSNPHLPIAQDGRPRNLQATIFLGKHFDVESEAPAKKLRQFMDLLRFDVLEADEYRALPIPEKVQKLIERQDIYVGLVTGQREHSWLIAEASFAQGKNRLVIMVVEEGSIFNPTIQGRDYEQILFPPDLVEKSFIKLLQEFRSLGISGL